MKGSQKFKEVKEKEQGRRYHIFIRQTEMKKKFLPEEAVEIMKHMNPQQLVNFLLPNDDWYVKTLSSNASGS